MKFFYAARRMREILTDDKPLRSIAARILWASRLSSFFKIRKDGYQLRFFPTSVSCTYWIDSDARLEDEIIIRSFLDESSTYVDVGANVGTLVLAAAQKIKHGTVIAFEPNPRIADYLRRNVDINDFSNVVIHAKAVGHENGLIRISDNRADDMNFVGTNGIEVPMVTLDSIIPSSMKIDLLKIDVEGFERFVLLGAEDTLKRTNLIYIEVCNRNAERYGDRADDLISMLHKSGFSCNYVDSDISIKPWEEGRRPVGNNVLAIKKK